MKRRETNVEETKNGVRSPYSTRNVLSISTGMCLLLLIFANACIKTRSTERKEGPEIGTYSHLGKEIEEEPLEKEEKGFVYQEKGLLIHFKYPRKGKEDVYPGGGAVLYYVENNDPTKPQNVSNAEDLAEIRETLRLDPEEYEDVEHRSVVESLDANKQIKLYTVAVMYSGELMKTTLGEGPGELLQDFTEELAYAYNWQKQAKDSIRLELRDLLNSKETPTLDRAEFETLPEIQDVTSTAIPAELFKNIYLSPFVDADPFKQELNYGMGFELMFLPGKSKVFYNGPENTFSYSLQYNF